MIYFSGTSHRERTLGPRIGLLVQPKNWNGYRKQLLRYSLWAADTGLYRKDLHAFDMAAWIARLCEVGDEERIRCAFVTARDAYLDHATTTAFSRLDCILIRASGFPAAYIAQNGATCCNVPWSVFDVLFLGGDTTWKLSRDAWLLVQEARRQGKRTHMGRVNSERRYRLAASWGCNSADGTLLAFGHDANFPRLRSWVNQGVMVYG